MSMNSVFFSAIPGKAVRKSVWNGEYFHQYVDITDGEIYFGCQENGTGIPVNVYNGTVVRIYFDGCDKIMTQKARSYFFEINKDLFQKVVNGIESESDTEALSEEADTALGLLKLNASVYYLSDIFGRRK